MSGPDLTRRRGGLLALQALLLGMAIRPAISWAAQGAQGAQGVPLPAGPHALTRRLSRGLRDGKAVVVTRSWRVDFARQARGIAIAGAQTSVSVSAPPRLAPLVKIEEQRSTEQMFPILLAPDGIIIAAGQNTSRQSIDLALDAAQQLLEESGFAKQGAVQDGMRLAQLQKAGAGLLDELPGDLFYPSATPFSEVRLVPLPDGQMGEFELRWEASLQPGSPLLDTARREFITRIAKSERNSVEQWWLAPL